MPRDSLMDQAPPARCRGPLIIVSGPSGVGKTTVVDQVLTGSSLPLRRAITATTRPPRAGERPGVSYHFWSREEFDRANRDGLMLESALVFGTDYYGTPLDEVVPYQDRGKGVIVVIDVQGAARLRQVSPESLSIFITPPSFAELEARLRGRGDMTEERIQRRLVTAREEMLRAGEFDHKIVNDDLGCAVAAMERLIREQFPSQE